MCGLRWRPRMRSCFKCINITLKSMVIILSMKILLSYTYIFVFCHSLMYIIGFMWALKTSFPIITTTIIIGMMMMMRILLLIWYLIKESQRIKKEGKKFATITTTTKMFKFHRWDGPYIFFFTQFYGLKMDVN